ncbi:MAG: DNA polymerase III subunit delta [Deltaproteobacteria bacterium]|nr:DNA polymerase III subunit delta [Deltaproteobacteria bacterium]
MITPFEDLLSQLKRKIEPLYFFNDESHFFSDVLIERIKKQVLPKATSENTFLYYGSEFRLESFLEQVKNVSLFSSKRLFICKEADRFSKEDQTEILSVIEAPSSGNYFIFVSYQKPSHDIFRFCKKTGCVFEFKKPYDSKMPYWVNWIAREHNQFIEPQAVMLLLEKGGTDLHQVQMEMNKLSLYVGKKSKIEAADVKELLYSTRSHSIFELTNAIGNRKRREALTLIEQLLLEGESEIFIFSMLVRFLRNLWKALEWRASKSDAEVQKLLGLHPFFWEEFRRYRDLAVRCPFEEIWKKASQVDVLLKTTSVDKKNVLYRFVAEVC